MEILLKPDCLVSQMLRNKYFKHGILLEVKLGQRLFYLWRSFVAALDLIKEMYFWRIGNGINTRIWGDKWILIPSLFIVQSTNQVLEPNAKVSSLIDPISGDWNREFIYQVFKEGELAIISSIPVSRTGVVDKMIWWPSKDEKFSVKFVYHLEKAKK